MLWFPRRKRRYSSTHRYEYCCHNPIRGTASNHYSSRQLAHKDNSQHIVGSLNHHYQHNATAPPNLHLSLLTWLAQAATSRPPLEPPWIASFAGLVYLCKATTNGMSTMMAVGEFDIRAPSDTLNRMRQIEKR